MDKNKLYQIIVDQQELFESKDDLIERDTNYDTYIDNDEITVITGIRRCGKSSLLKLISKKLDKKFIYINFDDIRFTDFSIDNFTDIEDVVYDIYKTDEVIYFLDEVQSIKLWEKWVNNLYDKKKKVFVTGSNSSLLSSELSTYLTGRHKIIKLFPFSFKEFLRLKNIKIEKSSKNKRRIFSAFKEYFEIGGFPSVIRNEDYELSKQYFEDIINKDVVNRYNIKKVKEFNDLILYLFSNAGQIYSYSTLMKVSGIKSLSMIKNYIDYLENVFLAYTINRFDYSIKKQKVSSSKFYISDNSFFKSIGFNFSKNLGKRLENLVFINLVRKECSVYYHYDKKECDFVIKEGLKIKNVIQVSVNMDSIKTNQREIDGLLNAMQKYKLKEGLILTMNTEDNIKIKNKKIIIKPVWKWLLDED